MFKILEYSHLGGAEILQVRFPKISKEIDDVIGSITKVKKLKKSKEKTKKNRMLYSPKDLNKRFTKALNAKGYEQLIDRYTVKIPGHNYEVKGAYKQVDFAKNKVLVEVQFGKYPFMFYDLFKEANAEVGVEMVPAHYMHRQMSSGTSYGEQLLWDIERLKRHFPSVPVKVILIGVEPLPTEHLVAEEGLKKSIAQQKEDV